MYRKLKRTTRGREQAESPPANRPEADGESPLTRDLGDNLQSILDTLGQGSDLIVRRLTMGGRLQAAVLYLRGMVDQKLLQEGVIRTLMAADLASGTTPMATVETEVINAGGVDRADTTTLPTQATG